VLLRATLTQQLVALALSSAFGMYPTTPAPDYLNLEFPVAGPADYADAHHDYPATDIFADCGERVVSPVRGVVLEVSRVDRWEPATNLGGDRGGKAFSIKGRDGVRYYGSHLSGIRQGITPGSTVSPGEHVGWVGRTGSARSTPCHLHFGLSPVCDGPGQWRVRRGVVSPYPYLRRWESGRHLSPADNVATWKRQHGCPAAPD